VTLRRENSQTRAYQQAVHRQGIAYEEKKEEGKEKRQGKK